MLFEQSVSQFEVGYAVVEGERNRLVINQGLNGQWRAVHAYWRGGNHGNCEVKISLPSKSEFAARVQARGYRTHRDSLPSNRGTTAFWSVMVQLLEPPYSRAQLESFFQHRASYGLIRHWRYGHCTAPPWALDLMRQEARRQIAKRNGAIDTLNSIRRPEGAGIRGTRALRAWRERKAREQDEKEKAAEMAALPL
jgi:hypothetical protein